MTAPFRLYGAALSPYTTKVRSYLQYKGLPFDFLERSVSRQEEFARYAKVPLAPLLVDADENVLQDSSTVIEALEQDFAEPSITPDDAALAFVATLIEDYADEWLSKAMFHYRWSYPEDQDNAARRTVELMFEGAPAPEGVEEAVRSRMVGRLHHIGSSLEAAPAIEASFARVLSLFDALLARNAYLLGGRPSLADFAVAGQLTQLLADPTPGALIRAQAPNVMRWIERMASPENGGGFASLDAIRAEVLALLRDEIAPAYLTWAAVNAQAVADDAPGVSVEIAGATFAQRPQRYAAKALRKLREKREALLENEALNALLTEAACDAFFGSNSDVEESEESEDGED